MLKQLFSQPITKIFLETEAKSFTYGWLQENLKKATALFKTLDISPSDRIILSTTNEVEMSVIFLAGLNEEIGVVVVDPDTKPPRVEAIIEKVRPALIITDK